MAYLAAALSTLAWATIGFMTMLHPSHAAAGGEISAGAAAAASGPMAVVIVGLVGSLVLPIAAARARPRGFPLVFGLSLFLLLGLAATAGLVFHRDFFTFPAQVILLHFALLLFRLDDLAWVRDRVAVYRRLAAASTVVFILWICWIMLMSYAIVTRSEPRWIESTAYNVVGGIVGLFLLVAAAGLHRRSRRTVFRRGDRVFLDERDVSELLSPQENLLVLTFLSAPDGSMTCRDLVEKLRGFGDDRVATCRQCVKEDWTASDCPSYRNLKNRVHEAKRYLELLQIGTICPVSENPRRIKDEGWRLRLFDDVRLAARRGPSV